MNRGGSFLKSNRGSLAIAAALACLLAPASQASVRSQVIQVCRSEIQSKKGEVRKSYCSSAKDYLNARNSHTAGSMVWSGVAAICTKSCADPTRLSSPICSKANLGGAATTGVIEKNFVEGLSPLATNAATNMGQKVLEKKGAETAAKKSVLGGATDIEPCKSAVVAAKSSFQKFRSASQEKNKIQEIKDSAGKLDETAAQPLVTFKGSEPLPGRAAATAGVIVGENKSCAEERLTTALAVLECATGTNPDLPQGVATQEFLRDLEKATGKPADQFFAKFQDPATSLFNGVSPSLNDSQRQALVKSIRDIHADASQGQGMSESGAYATLSGGGAKKSGEGEADFDMAGALNQLMGQLGEAGAIDEENGAAQGVESRSFDSKRSPAWISPEDTTYSIFDRVKLRYSAVTQKQHLGDERR